jgi:hypothetical protein
LRCDKAESSGLLRRRRQVNRDFFLIRAQRLLSDQHSLATATRIFNAQDLMVPRGQAIDVKRADSKRGRSTGRRVCELNPHHARAGE